MDQPTTSNGRMSENTRECRSMILGTKWIKKWFKPGSRMTKNELIELIHSGEISGWVKGSTLNGIPYVNENDWELSLARPAPRPAEQLITALHLLQ
jgi:hypothetical protein